MVGVYKATELGNTGLNSFCKTYDYYHEAK